MNTSQDTEITLGTGKMLLLFFGLVAVCAVFFGVGFSLGRNSAKSGILAMDSNVPSTPVAVVRPSAVKSNGTQAVSDPPSYKQVAQQDTVPAASSRSPEPATPSPADDSSKGAAANPTASPSAGNYYVQVAAVSKQEDADALVDALKKKQYVAFAATNSPMDKLFHVQVGPFGEIKEAEATRAKLISDGYNPIVKK